jgi:hypothetical protein
LIVLSWKLLIFYEVFEIIRPGGSLILEYLKNQNWWFFKRFKEPHNTDAYLQILEILVEEE